MRAIVFDKHSPALDAYHLVDSFPMPVPASGEVLIKVAFAALNRLDNWVRIGWKTLELDFPHIPCSDFSGTIIALGDGCAGLGDRPTGHSQSADLVWRLPGLPAWRAQSVPDRPG